MEHVELGVNIRELSSRSGSVSSRAGMNLQVASSGEYSALGGAKKYGIDDIHGSLSRSGPEYH
jgi:hypothetical protein